MKAVEDRTNQILRLVIDHNPFFLLSACLVLAGGWLLAGGDRAPSQGHILALFAFLQSYEILLIAAVAVVERAAGPSFRKGQGLLRGDPASRRDAATLVALEMLFLADAAFAQDALVGAGPVGAALGIAAFAAGPLKLLGLGVAARIRWPGAFYAHLVAVLALVHGAPALASVWAASGVPPEHLVAGLFFGAGALPLVLAASVAAGPGRTGPFRTSLSRLVRWLGGGLAVGALLHLFSAAWAHGVTVNAWFFAPLLVGLGAALPLLFPEMTQDVRLGPLAVALVGAGIVAAASSPVAARVALVVPVRPLVATLVAATLALAHLALTLGHRRLLYLSAACGVAAALGGRPDALVEGLRHPSLLLVAAAAVASIGLAVFRRDLAAAIVLGLFAGLGGVDALRVRGVASGPGDLLTAASALVLIQLVLVHAYEGLGWRSIRTILATLSLAAAVAGSVARGPSILDGYPAALVVWGLVAPILGCRCYVLPAALAGASLLAFRAAPACPSGRLGAGLAASVAGVLFLGLGLGVSVARSRLRDLVGGGDG